jgi:hypothetical protein
MRPTVPQTYVDQLLYALVIIKQIAKENFYRLFQRILWLSFAVPLLERLHEQKKDHPCRGDDA